MSTCNDPTVPHTTDVLKAQASEVARVVSDTVNEQANVLRDATATVRYNTQEFIENNPWQSIAMAAAFGFFVGLALGRRR